METHSDWGPWRCGSVTASYMGTEKTAWSLYTNDLFIVTVVPFLCDFGNCQHMVMRLKPGAAPLAGLTWSAKQRVKNELMGYSRVAVEVFPKSDELVDQADAYHLWVLPEGFRLPFGVTEETAI